MNPTWMALSNSDKIAARYDYNTFIHADLFFNGTLNEVSNDINVIYQSFFSSSTLVAPYRQNSSDGNLSSFIHSSGAQGISTPLGKLILTFLMSTMAFLTVAGNSLVILAFLCEPTIRTYSNYFILNLSIADLLIGLIWWVHPFSNCRSLFLHNRKHRKNGRTMRRKLVFLQLLFDQLFPAERNWYWSQIADHQCLTELFSARIWLHSEGNMFLLRLCGTIRQMRDPTTSVHQTEWIRRPISC